MSDKETTKTETFWKYFRLDSETWATTLSAIAGRYFWLANPAAFGDVTDNPWSYSKHSRMPVFFHHNAIDRYERIWDICDKIKAKREDEKEQNVPWPDRDRSLYDPFVCRTIDMVEGKYKQKDSYFLYDIQSIGDNEAGVFCFSNSPDNMYLWDKYASSHSGFCLGFEFTEGHGIAEKAKVDYKDTRQLRFDLCEVLLSPEILWGSFHTKDSRFKAEDEYRIVHSLNPIHLDPNSPFFSERRKFREFRLTECLLGVNFPANLVDILTAALPPHVVIGKAELPYLGNGDKKINFMGFGAGNRGTYYRAGRDRRILDQLNQQQKVKVDLEEYEKGREEGFSQIRSDKPIFSDIQARKECLQ